MLEEIHEECGVIGIFNGENISRNIAMGLYALQHRGQESAGIAITAGDKIRVRKSMGLVSALLREHNVDELTGLLESVMPDIAPLDPVLLLTHNLF